LTETRLKILFHTRFHPNIGGIETVASILAHEWHSSRHIVTVVTDVPFRENSKMNFPFSVYHRPKPLQFVRLVRQHDVFVHFNISLRAVWPLLLIKKPFVATHHGFYIVDRTGYRDWREKLKLRVARLASRNIAVSQAVKNAMGLECCIIPNPFDATLFGKAKIHRNKDLIFVGRLVSDKGADVLIKALRVLRGRGLTPNLTIVGDGPERKALEKFVSEQRLDGQICFTGAKAQTEVGELLGQHRIIVVPSLWQEPFGVVALEGIASGCVVVGSNGGGLPEAVGPCGVTFPNGDVDQLADSLEKVLNDESFRKALLSNSENHLAKHSPKLVAQQYLNCFQEARNAFRE
jgi:glycosyltransferase involved in cell wall biosynthesis